MDTSEERTEFKLKNIESKIGLHPDFPKKGILFRVQQIPRSLNRLQTLINHIIDPNLLNCMIELLVEKVKGFEFNRILGIESRGFLIGPLLAQKLQVPFGPIRKKGKLPGELYSVDYELEYGHDVLQVQKNGLPPNSKCLIVDDLIATGGSMEAAKKLVKLSGSQVAAYVVIIELANLRGRDKLQDAPLVQLFSY